MGRYLKRVMIDAGVKGVESWYYAKNGKVAVSQLDDVMIDMDRPFVCPDCSGTFLLEMAFMRDDWFHDKYICRDCRAVFIKR